MSTLMPRRWKLFRRPEPRMESWLSSAAPNRGRIITPGTHSIASLRLAARVSSMAGWPTMPTPPGVRSISSRARSGLMRRSSGTRSPPTRTGGIVGGVEGWVGWAHAGVARARHITTVAIRRMRAPLFEDELNGETHPHADGLAAAGPGLELPPPDRLGGRATEVGMARGLVRLDLGDAPVGGDVHAEQRGALDAETARRRGVGRAPLIAPARRRGTRDTRVRRSFRHRGRRGDRRGGGELRACRGRLRGGDHQPA